MKRASISAILVGIRRIVGWSLILGAIVLLALTLVTYHKQPDHFAAFTLMPIWVWCGVGLGAALGGGYLCGSRLAWFPAITWIAVFFFVADEASTLANFWKEPPRPGPAEPHKGAAVIRVITANLDLQPIPELNKWKPDVVLLQDVWPHQAHRIARDLFGAEANIHFHETNAIITRWEIIDQDARPNQRTHQVTIRHPENERTFKVVNVHLLSAATDLSLWRRSVWTDHRVNRAVRLNELDRALTSLKSATRFPDAPAILGGDFNAPPGDTIYRRIEEHFRDAHPAAGRRPGNTYHRRFPILRIDRIHATPHFTPVRSTTDIAARSDHRIVIADFVFKR